MAVRLPPSGTTETAVGTCEVWRRSRGRSTQVPFRGVPVGAHRYVWSATIHRREYKALQCSRRRTCGGRDTVPVTMRPETSGWRAGSHGGASLAPGPAGRKGASRGSWLATRAAVRSDAREAQAPPVLRIVHTADVHLGARHADLGRARGGPARAPVRRVRRPPVDLAIEERVDLFLIAGDLFDSNTQPRRSVERVAAELARLGGRHPDGHHPGHARRLRPRVDLPRLRPRGARRQRPGRRLRHGAHAGPPVGPPGRAATWSSSGRSSRPSGRRRARSRASTVGRPRGDATGSAWSTARSRSRARPTATTS